MIFSMLITSQAFSAQRSKMSVAPTATAQAAQSDDMNLLAILRENPDHWADASESPDSDDEQGNEVQPSVESSAPSAPRDATSVGQKKKRAPGKKPSARKPIACRYGDACTKPGCRFWHQKDGSTPSPKGKQPRPVKGPKPVKRSNKCKNGPNCPNIADCTFDHSEEKDDQGRTRCKAWKKCSNTHPAHIGKYFHPKDVSAPTSTPAPAPIVVDLPPPPSTVQFEEVKVATPAPKQVSKPASPVRAANTERKERKSTCFFHTKGACTNTTPEHLSEYAHPPLKHCRYGAGCRDTGKGHMWNYIHPMAPTNRAPSTSPQPCKYGETCWKYLAILGGSATQEHRDHCARFLHVGVPTPQR